jgi:hypothetical protein
LLGHNAGELEREKYSYERLVYGWSFEESYKSSIGYRQKM